MDIGQYLRHTESKRTKKTCMWLRRDDVKRETEATLIAAHHQAITTNAMRVKIHKQQGSACVECARKKKSLFDIY